MASADAPRLPAVANAKAERVPNEAVQSSVDVWGKKLGVKIVLLVEQEAPFGAAPDTVPADINARADAGLGMRLTASSALNEKQTTARKMLDGTVLRR